MLVHKNLRFIANENTPLREKHNAIMKSFRAENLIYPINRARKVIKLTVQKNVDEACKNNVATTTAIHCITKYALRRWQALSF